MNRNADCEPGTYRKGNLIKALVAEWKQISAASFEKRMDSFLQEWKKIATPA